LPYLHEVIAANAVDHGAHIERCQIDSDGVSSGLRNEVGGVHSYRVVVRVARRLQVSIGTCQGLLAHCNGVPIVNVSMLASQP
jgi:hypothetical protein